MKYIRIANIRRQFFASWKFALSFLKKRWKLRDYPVQVVKQTENRKSGIISNSRKIQAYRADIVNWVGLSATGETPKNAIRNLAELFYGARMCRDAMPRPGTRVPIEFASQARILENSAMVEEFLKSVLGHEEAWISDESSLWDFALGDSINEYFEKIRDLYGVDVSNISNGNLADIIDRIAQSKQNRSCNP
jgi:hypothetical protein